MMSTLVIKWDLREFWIGNVTASWEDGHIWGKIAGAPVPGNSRSTIQLVVDHCERLCSGASWGVGDVGGHGKIQGPVATC